LSELDLHKTIFKGQGDYTLWPYRGVCLFKH
jgi:hypothetical protein